MLIKLIIISVIALGCAVIGLGVQVFFSKKKKFPATHIGGNKNMRKLGIKCASAEEGAPCGGRRNFTSRNTKLRSNM